MRCRGRHEIAGLGEARGRAVVEHEAVVVQHHAIARLAHGELGETVDIDAVEEFRGVRPLDVDLAEGRDIGDADALAHQPHLLDIGLAHVIAGPAVAPGRMPGPGLDHLAAVRECQSCSGERRMRAEMMAACCARRARRGDRRIGRAEGRGAGRGNATPRSPGHDGKGVHVVVLPWSVPMPSVV